MQYNKQGKTDYCRKKPTPMGSPDNKESRIKALVDGMVKILVNLEKVASEVSRFRRLQSLSPNRGRPRCSNYGEESHFKRDCEQPRKEMDNHVTLSEDNIPVGSGIRT